MLGSHRTLQNGQDYAPFPAPGSLCGALIFFKRKLGVLFPVSLEVQRLQIASLNLVPCVVGGGPSGPSDESTPQRLGQRKHQWSHKPPTVQRKTRLLQRRNFPPITSPAQRPSGYRHEGKGGRVKSESSHSPVQATQGIPRTLASTPLGLVSGSRRFFSPS